MAAYYHHTFALTGDEETDFLTCKTKFSTVAILRRGIKECLKEIPQPPQAIIKKAQDIIHE